MVGLDGQKVLLIPGTDQKQIKAYLFVWLL